MEEENIIGKRFTIPFQKSVIFATIALMVVGAACLILSFLSDSNYDTALVFLVLGIIVIVVAILTLVLELVRSKKRKKVEGKPTVILQDENTLKVILTNGKEVEVDLNNIVRIKAKKRITVGGVVVYTVKTFADGSLVIYLNNNSKIKVGEVADVDNVQQKLYELKNKIQKV